MTKCKLVLGMITLNEAHNLAEVLPTAKVVFDEIIVVDSGSSDRTKELCLEYDVRFYFNEFNGFGNQWNHLLSLVEEGDFFVKMDPDERYDLGLRNILQLASKSSSTQGVVFTLKRRWHFLGKRLRIKDTVLRGWIVQPGISFSNNSLNERPVGYSKIKALKYSIDHLDSPDLSHWIAKNNHYSSLEADNYLSGLKYDTLPSFRSIRGLKMLVKKYFFQIPFRYGFVFCYFFFWKGLFLDGYRGYLSSLLWTSNYRWKEIKMKERSKWNK